MEDVGNEMGLSEGLQTIENNLEYKREREREGKGTYSRKFPGTHFTTYVRADGTSSSSCVRSWGLGMVAAGLLRLNVDNEAADLADFFVADTYTAGGEMEQK